MNLEHKKTIECNQGAIRAVRYNGKLMNNFDRFAILNSDQITRKGNIWSSF